MQELQQELDTVQQEDKRSIYKGLNVLDPMLNARDQINYEVQRSASSIIMSQFQASSASSSSVQIPAVIPNLSTFVDSKVRLRGIMDLAFSASVNNATAGALYYRIFEDNDTSALKEDGTAAGASLVNLMAKGTFAPSAWPFMSQVDNTVITLNQLPISIPSGEVMDILERLIPDEVCREELSTCPTLTDKFRSFSSADADASCNVLGDYNNSGFSDAPRPRGSFPFTIIYPTTAAGTPQNCVKIATTATATVSCTVRLYIDELVPLSPLLLSSRISSYSGMYGLQNINFNFRMKNAVNCFKMVSNPLLVNLTATVSNIDRANFYVNIKTCQPVQGSKFLMAPRNVHPYTKYEIESTNCPTITYTNVDLTNLNASLPLTTLSSNNVQLQKIPNAVIIACRKKRSAVGVSDSNSFLPIHNVSLNFNGGSSVLNSFNVVELYEATRRNGCNVSYDQYYGYTKLGGQYVATSGSPCMLKFGPDVQLGSLEAAGVVGSYNFQAIVQVHNNTAAPITADYELFLTFVYNGFIVNELGVSESFVGFLSKLDVERVSNEDLVQLPFNRRNHMLGGAQGGGIAEIWDQIKKIGKVVTKFGKTFATFVPHPAAQTASKVLGQIDDSGIWGSSMHSAGSMRSAGASRLKSRAKPY